MAFSVKAASRSLLLFSKYRLSSAQAMRTCSSISTADKINDPDIGRVFTDPRVQNQLRSLTGIDIDRIHELRVDHQDPLSEYHLMTNGQLKEAYEDSVNASVPRLQMVPVLPPRGDREKVLRKNEEVAGLLSSTLVCTDITYGVPARERLIVTRSTDGTLSTASWDLWHRMNQTYFPIEGRSLNTPNMFLEGNRQQFLDLLREQKYEYVLHRACVQFEPDDPLFLKVAHEVYDYVSRERDFDVLRSTRHYGGLVFYLVCKRNVANLLHDSLRTEGMNSALTLMELFNIVWPGEVEGDTPTSFEEQSQHILKFAEVHCSQKLGEIQVFLQSLMEGEPEKAESV